MIIAKLENAKSHYGLHERMEIALKYLENTDLINAENGKYEVEGDDVFAIVQDYQSKPESEGKWEAHKKYIDIQYIIKGREKIGCGGIEKFSAITEYDSEKDIFFLEGNGELSEISEGVMMILMPEDVHMPGLSVGEQGYVKKVVIKVRDWR